jgi:hypothetical protein
MPGLTGTDYSYSIQRRCGDGACKDLMTSGDAAAAGPMPRPTASSMPSARSPRASSIYNIVDDVKFGIVPLVDFAILPPQSEGESQLRRHEHRCLYFGQPFGASALQIASQYCSAGREVVDRALVARMLDRQTLVIGDSALDKSFARAEVKRTFWSRRSLILAATPEHGDETAPARATKLKAALCSRVAAR